MLAFGLIILVVATQMLTTRNISGLQKGNKEAAITFSINNRLQELVNLSFELEAKLLRYDSDNLNRQSIEDSLTMLGYNASILQDINLNIEAVNRFKKLNAFIDRQIGISLKVIGEKKEMRGSPWIRLETHICLIVFTAQLYLFKNTWKKILVIRWPIILRPPDGFLHIIKH